MWASAFHGNSYVSTMLTTCDHWSHQVRIRCKQTQVSHKSWSVRFSWRSDTDRVCPPEIQTRCRRGVKGEKDKDKEKKVTWGQIRDNYTCLDNTENKRLHVCVLMAERGGRDKKPYPSDNKSSSHTHTEFLAHSSSFNF